MKKWTPGLATDQVFGILGLLGLLDLISLNSGDSRYFSLAFFPAQTFDRCDSHATTLGSGETVNTLSVCCSCVVGLVGIQVHHVLE